MRCVRLFVWGNFVGIGCPFRLPFGAKRIDFGSQGINLRPHRRQFLLMMIDGHAFSDFLAEFQRLISILLSHFHLSLFPHRFRQFLRGFSIQPRTSFVELLRQACLLGPGPLVHFGEASLCLLGAGLSLLHVAVVQLVHHPRGGGLEVRPFGTQPVVQLLERLLQQQNPFLLLLAVGRIGVQSLHAFQRVLDGLAHDVFNFV